MAVDELRNMGVSNEDISYASVKEDKLEEAKEGAATGASTGGVIGAIAGLAVATGILPGLGTLIVAGPLAAALGLSGAVATTAAGAITGAAAGGIIGALAKWGVSEVEAKTYEERLKRGSILLIVTSELEEVKDVFKRHKGDEIREYEANA